jgi:hypothetical protein
VQRVHLAEVGLPQHFTVRIKTVEPVGAEVREHVLVPPRRMRVNLKKLLQK